VAERLGVVL